MDIKNLTEENVTELVGKLDEMKKTNPDITHRVYEMSAPITMSDIWDKLNAIEDRLKRTFNDYILVDGIWRRPLA